MFGRNAEAVPGMIRGATFHANNFIYRDFIVNRDVKKL
jgi:hypothetical protein